MNRFFKVGATLALSMGVLMGCGADEGNETATNNENNDNNGEVKEEVDLTLWLDNSDWAGSLTDALADEFPHININFEEIGSVDTLPKLELDGPAGLGADIMLIPHDRIATALSQNLLLPLGESFGNMMEGRVLPASLETVNHDDNYFGVPLSTESIALFYNRTLLEENGLEVATSFEELMEQAEVFNNPAANEFLLRFDVNDAFISHFFLTAAGFELFGPNHDDAEAVNFNTDEVVAGLEFFQSVREILPVPAGDLDWENTVGAFVAGKVPYVITGPWAISDIQNNGDFEWGVTTIPTINGAQPLTFSGNIIGVISSFSQNIEAAREVLEFMASDAGLQIMYDTKGAIPALTDSSLIQGLATDEVNLAILEQAEYHSHPMPIIPEMASYWDPAAAMFESVWEGLVTPEEAAEAAYNAFNNLLNLQ